MPTQAEYTRWLTLLDEMVTEVTPGGMLPFADLYVSVLKAKKQEADGKHRALEKLEKFGREPLPPMQPIPGKRARTRNVPCKTCGARPGADCFRLTSRGPHALPTEDHLLDGNGKPMYHKARSDRAKATAA